MTLRKFERAGDVRPETAARLRDAGHAALADVLETTGTGYIDDGFVRVIDPEDIGAHLESLFVDPDGAVPFATTALGDIVLARASSVDVAQLRTGQVVPFQPDAEAFLRAAESMTFRMVHLHATAYLDRPRPAIERAYFATPLEAFGGSGAPATLRETDLLTPWLAASRVIGRAHLTPATT